MVSSTAYYPIGTEGVAINCMHVKWIKFLVCYSLFYTTLFIQRGQIRLSIDEIKAGKQTISGASIQQVHTVCDAVHTLFYNV